MNKTFAFQEIRSSLRIVSAIRNNNFNYVSIPTFEGTRKNAELNDFFYWVEREKNAIVKTSLIEHENGLDCELTTESRAVHRKK